MLKRIQSELTAMFQGAGLHTSPLMLVDGSIQLLVAPWLAGREAGIGAFKMEKSGHPYQFLSILDKTTFEGVAARQSLRNAWNEAKGFGKSLVPLVASLPVASMMTGSEGNVSPEVATFMTTVHVVGGYLASRHHAKINLAPQYAQIFEQEWEENNSSIDNGLD